MPTKNPEIDQMRQVLDQMGAAGIATMSREAQTDYLSAMMLCAYKLLRTVQDDGFVRGFLESSLKDLETPADAFIRRPH